MANTSLAAVGFSRLPMTQQLGLLVVLAASIAIGVALVMWSAEPNYRPVYNNLNSQDASAIVEVLQRSGIEYKVDQRHGAILVTANDIHDARMKIAAEGLPRGIGTGFEVFSKKNGFSTSQFMETAKYRQALAGELARTISNFQYVKTARVHLAIPKASVFVRDKQKPTASVFVDVYAGRRLSQDAVSSILHLVAYSIPGLESKNVTIVDNQGNLLTEGGSDSTFSTANRYLKYRHMVETAYADKIQDLISPILGPGNVRARVTAQIDFTKKEHTEELFDQEKRHNKNATTGVPGALANTPPTAAKLGGKKGKHGKKNISSANDSIDQSTKNYEVSKKISHVQQTPGTITRLSVAVVLDDHKKVDAETGKVSRTPLKPEEITKITELVKDAIGFDDKRGDTLKVINSSFVQPEPIEAMPEPKLWEQAWFLDIVKQGGAGLLVLILIFGFLRPMMKRLAVVAATPEKSETDADGNNPKLPKPEKSLHEKIEHVHNLAHGEPKRVASIVKNWVESG